jgi:hypothetical protein
MLNGATARYRVLDAAVWRESWIAIRVSTEAQRIVLRDANGAANDIPLDRGWIQPANASAVYSLSPLATGQSHLKENLVGRFLCGPSFETPAFGGLLRMRSCFAAKY